MKISQKLFGKYINGEADHYERHIIEKWYEQLDIEGTSNVTDEEKVYQLAQIRSRLPSTKSSTVSLWRRWTAVAAVSLIAITVIYLHQQWTRKVPSDRVTFIRDIKAGKRGGKLTLADGRSIYLSDALQGTLAQEAGINIKRDKSGGITYELIQNSKQNIFQTHTLSTTNGETQRIRLQDGSIVYLNAASSITYPASFKNAPIRKVELKGEGYFEIAKDSKHPFVVSTRNQNVQVLGTHFNINAYDNEPNVTTALFEGSIKINTTFAKQKLKPGQLAVLKNNTIKLGPANEDVILSWKNDRFIFNDESLESIMRKIGRWYDVTVIYENVDKSDTFGGSMTRNANLSVVLKTLAMTEGIHFRIEGKKLYVLPSK